MKILIVTQYFYPEAFRVNALATELVNRGNEVTVLTGYPQYPKGEIFEGYGFKIPYEKEWNGVKIVRIKVQPRGKSKLGLVKNCFTFVTQGYKWVRKCKEKYDVVYVYEVSPVTVGLPAIKYKKKFGTPVFFNVQDLWPENVQEVLGINNKLIIGCINKIVDKIYKNSDAILCSSHGFIDNISNRGVSKDKLIYWPQFCEEPDFNELKKPNSYNSNAFNIVFTGNIGEAQGLELLIDSADKLKNENIVWHIVGDGRAKEKLQKSVENKKLNDKIIFHGKVSEKEANEFVYYSDCAYLSLLKNKLFDLTVPAKLQTYLACGVPIIGAISGESEYIINNNNCGIAVNQNVDEIVNAVKKIITSSKNDIDSMKSNAKKCYKENYQKGLLVDNLVELMEKYESIND